jgi:uncharacterized spore protein YtfJ
VGTTTAKITDNAAPGGEPLAAALARPVREALRANQVHGEPIHAHGVTLVPVARVGGGTDGGAGRGPQDRGEGSGGGAGFAGRPVGAFVLSEGTVRWQPAVDVDRLVLVVAAVALFALLTARRIARLQGREGRCRR